MWSDGTPSGSVQALLERHVQGILSDLQRGHRRALEDNPDGSAVIAGALREAVLVGLRAQCEIDRRYLVSLDAGPDSWEQWQGAKDETPESLDWPAELEARAPEAAEHAGDALAAAGTELGIHGHELRELRGAGEQAAEAGAALGRSLVEPPRSQPDPIAAELAPVGRVQPDGTVSVATAANQAECELIQGLLRSAGIPSVWRRAGSDLPHLMSAGHRTVYVPASAAADAQLLLATQETSVDPPAAPAVQPVGLERTGVRLAGKATATLMLLGLATGAIYSFASDDKGLAIVLLAALVIAVAAIVTWSERGSQS